VAGRPVDTPGRTGHAVQVDDLEAARYARMRWNTPLSVEHAGLLLDRLDLRPGLRIADLGCGWGELLLRALARGGGTGTGVDTDPAALDRGRALARNVGLGDAVEFIDASVAHWRQVADRVLCVGSSHAFGGTRPALSALKAVVPHGGRLLMGDGIWEASPSAAAREIFGDLLDLPEWLEACRAEGWRVIHVSTADQREWDDFEFTWRAGRQEWLLAHGDDPRAAETRDWLDDRERAYVTVYRKVLGMAYAVLAR
jgi:SAM-dependent methyltransferase